MISKRLNLTSWLYLLPLLVFMCYDQAFCAEENGKFIVHDIRFGVIEPPVVLQKDITVRAPTSNQQTELKPLECSGLAWMNGYLLIVSDRHEHLVFTCAVDINNMVIEEPVPHVLVHNEKYLLKDSESIAVLQKNGQSLLYIMCSLSNAPDGQALPQRRNLLCCNIGVISPFEADHCNVLSAETLRGQLEDCFQKIKAKPYYTYYVDYPGENKNTYRWGNVEGITFTPDGQYMLCGMRNPLFDGAAILFAVSGMPRQTQLPQEETMKVTDFFLLDLQGRGVSDLAWDSVTQGYLITATKSNGPRLNPDQPFPLDTLDSAFFWWSGNKTDSPVLVARIADMTIEAVCRLGLSRYIVLGSDEGDISEGRTARQSILTVMEFTGTSR
jgi:hypothetical protein